ncbi:MAG: FecCD family ABC transporter permease [Haloechinothrix sp.]
MVLRSPRARVSLRVDGRSVAVACVLLATLVAVMAVTLTTGDFKLSLGEVIAALTGHAEGGADFIVNTLRLPRLLTGVFAGAALAVSGSIMQSLSRNPLGSPDIIGFTNGSATGALIVIIVLHGSVAQIAAGALAGGIATAVTVYLLAFAGGVQGFRFILVGIGVSAMLLAANSYLITRATWQDALAAQAWLIGTLNGRGWDQALLVGIALAVLLPIVLYYGRGLAMLEMGDDVAKALGVGVEHTRLMLIGVSVALAAIATAATGPVWFIAFAAPHLVSRLTRATGPGLLPCAIMGALLLAASDLAVQRVFASAQLPVGTATGTIGGLYLIWLLASEWRRGRA